MIKLVSEKKNLELIMRDSTQSPKEKSMKCIMLRTALCKTPYSVSMLIGVEKVQR
jgi:hypothetical protein